MRFLLYNIRYAAGIGVRFHLPVPYAGYLKRVGQNLDQIIAFIRSVHPDLIGLIEIDGGTYRAGFMNQAEVIARELGHYHLVEVKYGQESMAKKMPLLKKQGNALLTNRPIVSHRFHYFEEGVKRLIIEMNLEDVTVFLVHLSLTFRKRHNQLEHLYRLVRETRGPVIVAGDFNLLWGSRELKLFLGATGLVSANVDERPSHPSWAPRRQLDYILHSPDLSATGFYIPNVYFSDHSPLVCDFDI